MRQVYQSDSIKLDAERITEYDNDTFGLTTVFHDVPIASEMVQPYDDGRAWKHRDELEPYSWTVDGAWVIVGGHPAEGIISDRAQVSGRTVNPRYVKDLKDPKTKRPNRAGVRADIEIFNDKVPKETLDDMKNGKLQDVSIGFFYSKDESAGIIEDGPFKGDEYDYIQRNMFHNHTAAGIDNGRCPMPFCGLGADELRKRLAHDPFAGFEDFDACMAHMMKPKDEGGEGYDEETAKKVCGKLKEEHEDINKEEDALNNAKKKAINALLEILDAVEAAKGELDAKKTDKETWWKSLNWKDEDMKPIYQILDEETRQQITDEGLCPTCGDAARTEAERAKAHFELTDEEWEALSDEEKQEYIDKLPERGSGGEDEPEEDEALPYEDGEPLEYKLIPVDEKPIEEKKPVKLDPREVLDRATKLLG